MAIGNAQDLTTSVAVLGRLYTALHRPFHATHTSLSPRALSKRARGELARFYANPVRLRRRRSVCTLDQAVLM